VLLDVREAVIYDRAHPARADNVPLYKPLMEPKDGFEWARVVAFGALALRPPVRNERFVEEVTALVGGKKARGVCRLVCVQPAHAWCCADGMPCCPTLRPCHVMGAEHAHLCAVLIRRHARDGGGAQGARHSAHRLAHFAARWHTDLLLLACCLLLWRQIRAPRLPAPIFGKYGAASRSLLVRACACARA
jgi:hypothetical protein